MAGQEQQQQNLPNSSISPNSTRPSITSWHEAIFGGGNRQEEEDITNAEERDTFDTETLPSVVSPLSPKQLTLNLKSTRNVRFADLGASHESIRSASAEVESWSPGSRLSPVIPSDDANRTNDNESLDGVVLSSNVKMEGWSPSRLRIPPKPWPLVPDSRKRYTLTDPGPVGGDLPVLETKGQKVKRDNALLAVERALSNASSVYSTAE